MSQNNNLKICHVNTGAKGGAAIACQRLNIGLRERGLNSSMLCKAPQSQLEAGQVSCRNYFAEIFTRLRMKFSKIKPMIDSNRMNYEIYSSSSSFYPVASHSFVKNADIVHLHWISNFVDFNSFFATKKKIVWSLHDLNPFMGGLHYTLDIPRVTLDLAKYEDLLREKKHAAIRGKGIVFVFLSKWLYGEALKLAPWLKEEKIEFIPNGIDSNLFCWKEQLVVQQKLGLDPTKKHLLFVSESLDNYRKGLDLLLEAVDEKFASEHNLQLVAVGRIPDKKFSHIDYIGPVHDFSLLADYYRAVDGFILPSRQDNLPNVMLEALCCGCPVVSFPTGGMAEYLNSENGMLCESLDSASLREGITSFLARTYDRKKIAEDAKQMFDISVSVSKYERLYKKVMGQDL